MIGQVGGWIPTCSCIFLDLDSGGSYNDRRGVWVIFIVWGVHEEIEASGAGVGDCRVQGSNRGGDAVVDRL